MIFGAAVNVSGTVSLAGLRHCCPELQQKFTSETITEEESVGLVNKYVEDTKNKVHLEEGWPHTNITSFAVSKLGITFLSRIQARKLSENRREDKIFWNASSSGWVKANTRGSKATKPRTMNRDPCVLCTFSIECWRASGTIELNIGVKKTQ